MHHTSLASLASLASVALGLSLTACCARTTSGVLPPRLGPALPPQLTLVWVGQGQAERFDHGAWLRAEAFDYEFTVEQRRYADHWESVKHLRRRHPAYDGSAGPREQTMYFRVELPAADAQGRLPVRIASSLGAGEGETDREFRSTTLVLHPEISRFAPFDTYRIEQHYNYEAGALEEIVSLDKGTKPWVKNHETAVLFAPHEFDHAPTTR